MSAALPTLNLIGAGRVGQTLARLWTQAGVFAVQDVLTTSLASAQTACEFIGAGSPSPSLDAMRPADLWLIATTDARIAASASALAQHAMGMESHLGTIAFHCSGALSAAELAPLAALGWRTASAHPILSFANPASACTQFAGTPCALEGHARACEPLRAAFSAIGAQCFDVRSQDKLLYHAGAVFATNFVPVLQAVAEDAWQKSGVPQALIPHLRASLLQNAVANIIRLGPQGALTGPAARGDTAAIARQAEALAQWDPAAGAAYSALSALALRMANTSSTTDTSAAKKR
jgi:predicted short-subunit dehydrogenase-like oxidoreductase (DUF2520 family)